MKGISFFQKMIVTSLLGLARNSLLLPALPRINVWVTLANLTGQDTLCLATASPDNPFSTCLVGIPLDTWPVPNQAQLAYPPTNVSKNITDDWDG